MSVEALVSHFQEKLDNLRTILALQDVHRDESCQRMMCRLNETVHDLEYTMSLLHIEVKIQRNTLARTKVLKDNVRTFLDRVSYGNSHIPEHLPKPANSQEQNDGKKPSPSDKQLSQPTKSAHKTTSKTKTKEPVPVPTVALLTVEEFEAVPKYMKGRITYQQISTAIEEFNTALAAKHKILTTPRKKQSVQIKNKMVEYKEQETKHTEGFFFIMDADITEYSRLKMDTVGRKCLTIIRHCGRMKEQRSGRLVQYLVSPYNVCY